MRRFILAALLVYVALVIFLYRRDHRDPLEQRWKGQRAPDLELTAIDGTTVTLSELKGKQVVVDMWATWCPPCVAEIPHFVRLANEIPADELVVIGISDEPADVLKPFVESKGIPYTIVSANRLPPPFSEVVALPTTFFIGPEGTIKSVAVGYHDYEQLRDYVLR